MTDWRIAAHLFGSRANGPGRRAVVWVQGCDLGCPGCFNPSTHTAAAGAVVEPVAMAQSVAAAISEQHLDGVTISGGEPFQQLEGTLAFLQALRTASPDTGVIVFSGYTLVELHRRPGASDALALIDLLIAGRYAATRPHGQALLGSANQHHHHLTPRYQTADLDAVPEAEVVIADDGSVVVSGVAPPDLSSLHT